MDDESNRERLAQFLETGAIRLRPAPLLDRAPEPLETDDLEDRVRGMLLGLAIGDALGATSEGLNPTERRKMHGEVRGYLPNRHADGRAVGMPTDDTQLAFWALERMLEDDGLVPERVLQTYLDRRIFGIGSTVEGALIAFGAGRPWHEAGLASAGNGALMRIAPVVVPHLRDPSTELWADAALLGMITHNDFGSNAACIAFVDLLWALLGTTQPPDPVWWVERFTRAMGPLEGPTRYRPRTSDVYHEGPISAFAKEQVLNALDLELDTREACDHWYSGAYLLETVPSVLYVLARHGHDPEQAIIRAVNDTRDNDTVGAIVGAAVGALHGASALPGRWLENLLGRTGADDDDRVFDLIDRAIERWV